MAIKFNKETMKFEVWIHGQLAGEYDTLKQANKALREMRSELPD